MKQLYSVVFLVVGVAAVPALADGHGDRRGGAERSANAVKQMDANNDGAISFDEFRMPEGRDAPEMRMDVNGDGEITREEVSSVGRSGRRRRLFVSMRWMLMATVWSHKASVAD